VNKDYQFDEEVEKAQELIAQLSCFRIWMQTDPGIFRQISGWKFGIDEQQWLDSLYWPGGSTVLSGGWDLYCLLVVAIFTRTRLSRWRRVAAEPSSSVSCIQADRSVPFPVPWPCWSVAEPNPNRPGQASGTCADWMTPQLPLIMPTKRAGSWTSLLGHSYCRRT